MEQMGEEEVLEETERKRRLSPALISQDGRRRTSEAGEHHTSPFTSNERWRRSHPATFRVLLLRLAAPAQLFPQLAPLPDSSSRPRPNTRQPDDGRAESTAPLGERRDCHLAVKAGRGSGDQGSDSLSQKVNYQPVRRGLYHREKLMMWTKDDELEGRLLREQDGTRIQRNRRKRRHEQKGGREIHWSLGAIFLNVRLTKRREHVLPFCSAVRANIQPVRVCACLSAVSVTWGSCNSNRRSLCLSLVVVAVNRHLLSSHDDKTTSKTLNDEDASRGCAMASLSWPNTRHTGALLVHVTFFFIRMDVSV